MSEEPKKEESKALLPNTPVAKLTVTGILSAIAGSGGWVMSEVGRIERTLNENHVTATAAIQRLDTAEEEIRALRMMIFEMRGIKSPATIEAIWAEAMKDKDE